MHCPQSTNINHLSNVSIGCRNVGGRLLGPTSKALLLLATCGKGEPTNSTTKFVAMRKGKVGIGDICSNTIAAAAPRDDTKDDPADTARDAALLWDVDCVGFGLCNKNYEHCSNMGWLVDAALGRCGATRAMALGLGDDGDDLEGDFKACKDGAQ